MIYTDFDAVKSAYEKAYPNSPFFDTWVPREKFLSADVDGQGNITIGREDDGIYGIAIGSAPVIPTDWKNFSMDSRGIAGLPEGFKAVVEWDCYWAPTESGDPVDAQRSTDGEIAAFLKLHAPDSSVFPGNDEILQWVEIYDGGHLAAVAALCRWESGRVVISSVGTHTDLRGRGLGKQLIEKCLIAGSALGEKYLSLGVRHQNESAQRLYRSTGFTLMHNFTYCERR
jgi:ribosomal protein S18 acetylase RimI-like enzyme